jgi:uncharacterized protein YegJ (DUF2314 family)
MQGFNMTNKIFWIEGENAQMIAAYKQAQAKFKYCWRELSWESRRIIPALDFSYAKIAFAQEQNGDNKIEHMWVGDLYFDGDTIYGELLNEPNELTNIQQGDRVAVPLEQLSDWLFLSEGKPYGGFSIQAMRANMGPDERNQHDEAWGIDFGDPENIEYVLGQSESPQHLQEHPMSINMQQSLREFLHEHPAEITNQSDDGMTLLHRETIAGNASSVKILLESGADKSIKDTKGKTALDYAKQLDWQYIIPLLA